jgi:hypothetical protein
MNLTNEDLEGLYPVNVNALVENVKKYGRGNRNRSPNIRSPRLNDLPVISGFQFNSNYEREREAPVYVPKMKLNLSKTFKNKRGGAKKRRRVTRRSKANRT